MRNLLSSTIAGISGIKAKINFIRQMMSKMPNADQFREIMEERIAAMPEHERPEAQRKLEEAISQFPSNTEMKSVIDDISDKLNPENLSEADLLEVSGHLQREFPTEQ